MATIGGYNGSLFGGGYISSDIVNSKISFNLFSLGI